MSMRDRDQCRLPATGSSGPSRFGLRHRLAALLASTALAVQPVLAGDALPTGGQVVAGTASVAASGRTLTVTQGSDRAIVNWSGFSIGAGNAVNFAQPNSSSAILNRVTGTTPSTIAGSLTANGQVYLINPNGIAITATGTVKVGGGFVASTLDIGNDDFLKGQLSFTGTGASASVSNDGIITVGRGGYAALLGGTVKNDGLIAVPMGKVGLGSGEQATLDLSGDGFLQVAVPTRAGAEGSGALIDNAGTIKAEGGAVVMRAATARDAARHAINLTGVVEADSISGHDGAITIGGGDGGAVTLSGKLKAASTVARGGKITVTGQSIALKGATVDASGATGGGTVKIGGDRQGKGTTQHAETVQIDSDSVIKADATTSGTGGSVTVWSDHLTTFAGTITALGAGTGTGGDAEVSGKALLDYTGFTNLAGPKGFGTLTLDPYDVTISTGADSNASSFTATGNDSVINVTTLTTALSAANVTVTTGAFGSAGSQAGNITVADAVTWTSGSTLTLSAFGSIAVNANLTGGTGSSIVLRSDNSGTGTGTVSFGTGVTATASGGVSLYYNPTGNDNTSVNSTSYTTPTSYTANAGSGTTITAYMLVNTVYDLQNVQNNLSGTYALGRDIDASDTVNWNGGAGFAPIGSFNTNFAGTFDGDSHTITGLTINRGSAIDVGLFGYTAIGSVISNVGLIGGSTTGNSDVGGLVADGYATISNSYNTGSVDGQFVVGGLVGEGHGAISNSYATGSVRNHFSSYTGGLVGSNYGTISNSYATGSVSGTYVVGGLVGTSSGTIKNSYATGAVSSATDLGITYDQVGGLVGSSDGTIKDSYATGSVTGIAIGGLVGWNYSSGWIINSYATGAVRNYKDDFSDKAGGLVAVNDGTISNAYATGSVSGYSRVGGLVGSNSGTISNAYATGFVGLTISSSGNTPFVGGLIADNFGGTITNSFWDTETTGQSVGVAYESSTGYTGLTTAQARTAAAYTGWDFSTVWYQVGDMRPILRSEAATANADGVITIHNPHQLALVSTNLSGSYVLTTDIDASATDTTAATYSPSGIWGPTGWQPIGTTANTQLDFTGTFDGQGHTISGLTFSGTVTGTDSDPNRNFGLFASNVGAIRNVGLVGGGMNLTYTGGYESYAGMLAGTSTGGSIINVYETGPVKVTNTANDPFVGGLVGMIYNDVKVSNVYSTGAVTAINISGSVTEAGGIVGLDYGGTISNAYATGAVSAIANGPYGQSYAGGLVADTSSITISNSYASGAVSASSNLYAYAGGLVGWSSAVRLSNVYATGATTATSNAGDAFAGGLVGFGYFGSISNAYAAGLVSAIGSSSVQIGGLVGQSNSTITASFYDTQTTGQTGNASGITGLTTAQFQDTASFKAMASAQGWDFSTIWAPPSSGYYPELYAVTPVVWVSQKSVSSIYGSNTGTASLTTSGGSSTYVFGPSTDSLTIASATAVDPLANVGTTSTAMATTNQAVTSAMGVSYRVFSYGDQTNTVSPATLTVTAGIGTMVYGDTAPSLGYSVAGWKNGQTDSLLTGVDVTSTATSTSNVGTYTTSASGGTLTGAASGNYTVSYVTGSVSVTPASLTVTAGNGTMVYGDAAPSLAYSVSGWKNGQSDSLLSGVSVATDVTSASNVGTYTTSATGGTLTGAATGNYTVTYVNGAVTITPASLTVTAGNGTMVYGDAAPSLTYSVSGWKNGQSDSLLSGVSVATDATAESNVGTYTTSASGGTLSGAASGNYTVSYNTGALTVTPASLTVTAGAGSMVYGDAAPALGYSVAGWKNGQSDSLLSGVTVATTATATSNVGTYTTSASGGTLSGAASGNYTFTYVNGAVTVTPARLTVTAGNGRMYQGTRLPTLSYSVAGWKNGQGDGLLSGVTVSTDATLASLPGDYRTMASGGLLNGAAAGNYTLAYTDGTLTVSRPVPAPGDSSQLAAGIDLPAVQTPQTIVYANLSGVLPDSHILIQSGPCTSGSAGASSGGSCAAK